ncbi:MAG: DUF4395 domain-containing protein [Anaerolineae bacterium]
MRVDQTALKFNQASIIVLTLAAFVLDVPWLVAFVAVVMTVGTLWPAASLFKRVYTDVARPRGWLRPRVVSDNPEAHLFALGVGAVFMIASSLALLALNLPAVGWVLAWIVVVLAAINLFLGFCAGCFMYYQLERRFGIRPHLPSWRTASR